VHELVSLYGSCKNFLCPGENHVLVQVLMRAFKNGFHQVRTCMVLNFHQVRTCVVLDFHQVKYKNLRSKRA
jgi:hypothetical protein